MSSQRYMIDYLPRISEVTKLLHRVIHRVEEIPLLGPIVVFDNRGVVLKNLKEPIINPGKTFFKPSKNRYISRT